MFWHFCRSSWKLVGCCLVPKWIIPVHKPLHVTCCSVPASQTTIKCNLILFLKGLCKEPGNATCCSTMWYHVPPRTFLFHIHIYSIYLFIYIYIYTYRIQRLYANCTALAILLPWNYYPRWSPLLTEWVCRGQDRGGSHETWKSSWLVRNPPRLKKPSDPSMPIIDNCTGKTAI